MSIINTEQAPAAIGPYCASESGAGRRITARMRHYLDQHGFKGAIKGCIEEGTMRTRAFGERITEQFGS